MPGSLTRRQDTNEDINWDGRCELEQCLWNNGKFEEVDFISNDVVFLSLICTIMTNIPLYHFMVAGNCVTSKRLIGWS